MSFIFNPPKYFKCILQKNLSFMSFQQGEEQLLPESFSEFSYLDKWSLILAFTSLFLRNRRFSVSMLQHFCQNSY